MPRLIRNPLKVAEIKQLLSTKQIMLCIFPLQLAWELLVVRGYQRANILDAGVVSRWQVDHVSDVLNHHRQLVHEGGPSELWPEKEKLLLDWIYQRIYRKQYPSRPQIQSQADSIRRNNIQRNLEEMKDLPVGWADHFIERKKEFKVLRGHLLDWKRLKACIKKNLLPFYRNFQQISKKYMPGKIWNIDETSCNPEARQIQLVCNKSCKHATALEPKKHQNTTVTLCINAAGHKIKSQLIYKRVNVPDQFSSLDPQSVVVYTNNSGYLTKETFKDYMTNVVFPAIMNYRESTAQLIQHKEKKETKEINGKKEKKEANEVELRSLLIIDGHSSRIQPELWRIAYSQGIDVLTIPSHSSTVAQPLDCGTNATFKQKLAKFMALTEDRRESDIYAKAPSAAAAYRTCFADSFEDAFTIALMPSSVRAAWAASGLVPYDESVLNNLPDEIEDKGECAKKVQEKNRLSAKVSRQLKMLRWSESEEEEEEQCTSDDDESILIKEIIPNNRRLTRNDEGISVEAPLTNLIDLTDD
ncbi:MAG: hypothetical protein EZS28_001770 [Streblomastix strix]|uniref:HTH CENPB-type domain-containing protein n=1 Tax=Streblomastix strix TaxID=222440 RepID=A0A5J4X849_9EUKA|nr:MAG: hypothetical protein EZS28_001770 [Streblomastix strix]